MPSRFEGFGFPILEAMQHHAPVICSDAGALPEIACGNALIFKSGDSAHLSELMRLITQDDATRQSLTVNSGKVLKRYDWNKTAVQMLDAFYCDTRPAIGVMRPKAVANLNVRLTCQTPK